MTIKDKIKTQDDLQAIVQNAQKAEKKVVFTNGCFDLLHPGHVLYLEEAKESGDLLILGLNTDASIQRIKGPDRPINTQEKRALVIAALESIDFVTLFDENTPIALIERLKPDIYVKGGDYTPETLPETPIVNRYGGKIKILSFIEGNSTTATLQKIQSQQNASNR